MNNAFSSGSEGLEGNIQEMSSCSAQIRNVGEQQAQSEALQTTQYEALQTQEAELRRLEEEAVLVQAQAMVKQKIRACRQQIFSAMQRLQVLIWI